MFIAEAIAAPFATAVIDSSKSRFINLDLNFFFRCSLIAGILEEPPIGKTASMFFISTFPFFKNLSIVLSKHSKSFFINF